MVSEKGQITIPKAVRDRLGLNPGKVLQVEAVNGRLVAQKQVAADPSLNGGDGGNCLSRRTWTII